MAVNVNTSAAPAKLLSFLTTQPTIQKLIHGNASTLKLQPVNRPAADMIAWRVLGSVCHHEIPAAMTASATNPPAIFPPTVFRKSMSLPHILPRIVTEPPPPAVINRG